MADVAILKQQRDQLLSAARLVLAGLNERIHTDDPTPVFTGIAALHDAIENATTDQPTASP
jgi:hypothetical protein